MNTAIKFSLLEKRLICHEVEQMSSLRNAAGVIVDLVYELAPECSFVESTQCEWVLRPHNWIAMHFSYRQNRKRFHVSLDIWPQNLDAIPGLEIKHGRFPSWSKISVASVRDVPATLHHIVTAYEISAPDCRIEQFRGAPPAFLPNIES